MSITSGQTIYLNNFARYLLQNHLEKIQKEIAGIAVSDSGHYYIFSQDSGNDLNLSSATEELLQAISEFRKENSEQLPSLHQLKNTRQGWADNQSYTLKRWFFYTLKKLMLQYGYNYTADLIELKKLHEELENFFFNIENDGLKELMSKKDETLKITRNAGMEINKELKEARELGSVGSYYWNLVTGSYEVSKETEKILNVKQGATLDQFLSKIHPEDLSKVKEAVFLAGSGREKFDVEFRVTVKGEEKMLWCRGEIYAKDGVPTAMRGSLIDLTEKYLMLQNLRRSKKLYKEAQELAMLGNWGWNRAAGIVEGSEEFFRIYNMAPPSHGRIKFDDLVKFIHPDDVKETLDNISENGDKPIDMVYRLKFGNGIVKYVHSRSRPSDKRKLWRFGTLQDITRQKIIEEKLIQQQKFNLKLAEASPAIILSYAIDQRQVLFVNRAVKVIMGYEQEELLPNSYAFFKEKIHPDDYRYLVNDLKKQIFSINTPAEFDRINELQFRIKNKQGHYRWLNTYWVVFSLDDNMLPKELLTVSIDNTEQIEAERKIRMKTIELQQSNASLEEFARVASHDLKEPLRKISTFADRLEMWSNNLPDKGKEYLKKITDSAIRMQQLIDNLLDLSVITSEKTFQKQKLQPILEAVLHDLEIKIEETNAVITGNLNFLVPVNPSQFQQLMQNLLSNSLKFTRKGVAPQILISGKLLETGAALRYGLNPEDNYLQIKIEDNGIGFDPQFSRQIFNIFQRLNDKNEYSGTGIGLAICKKIVENHGGFIGAEGKPGVGTIIYIIIPAN